MEKNSKNIDHFFKEELGSYTETPPPAAWDALEKRLAGRPPAKPSFAFRKAGYLALLVTVASFTAVTIARKNADNAIAQNNVPAQETTGIVAQDAARATNAVSADVNKTQNTEEHTPAAKEPATAGTTPATNNTTIAKNEAAQTAGIPANESQPATQAIAKTEPTNTAAPQQATVTTENNKHIVPQATATTTHNTPVVSQHATATKTSKTTAHNNTTAVPHTSAMNNGTTHNAVPAATPSYTVSNKAHTRAVYQKGAIARTEQENTVSQNAPVIPQAHTKSNGHALALKTAKTTPVSPAKQQPSLAENLSMPADVANTAEENTEVPVAAKPIVPQAHKTTTNTPAQVSKNGTNKHAEEEVTSLTTGMKQIGITNSLSAMKPKSVPGVVTPVYNNSVNPEPEMHWNSGSKPQADVSAKAAPAPAMPPAVVKTTPKVKEEFDRFEAGIKAGYETGFSFDAATKYVASPYIQYNLSPKFALMLQPAVKAAKVNKRPIGTAQSYYKPNNDGVTKLEDSTPLYIAGTAETLWVNNYSYSQTHDSIVKTNTYGGTYIEVEMPLLLKYYIAPKFAVYAGANVTYSKLLGVQEQTYTSALIVKTGTADALSTNPAPALSSVITYTGNAYAGYTVPQYAGTNGSALRLGYMAGFSYQFTDKWMVDGLMQQGMAKQDVKAGYNINSAISAAYFRFTIGYKLTK